MANRVWLWLRRILVIAMALAALLVVALVVWWSLAGRDFLYRAIFPDDARLLADQTIPDELGEQELLTDLSFLEDQLPRLHVAFGEAFAEQELEARISELRGAADSYSSTRPAENVEPLLASPPPERRRRRTLIAAFDSSERHPGDAPTSRQAILSRR